MNFIYPLFFFGEYHHHWEVFLISLRWVLGLLWYYHSLRILWGLWHSLRPWCPTTIPIWFNALDKLFQPTSRIPARPLILTPKPGPWVRSTHASDHTIVPSLAWCQPSDSPTPPPSPEEAGRWEDAYLWEDTTHLQFFSNNLFNPL